MNMADLLDDDDNDFDLTGTTGQGQFNVCFAGYKCSFIWISIKTDFPRASCLSDRLSSNGHKRPRTEIGEDATTAGEDAHHEFGRIFWAFRDYSFAFIFTTCVLCPVKTYTIFHQKKSKEQHVQKEHGSD